MAIITTIFELFFTSLFLAYITNYIKNKRYAELVTLFSASTFGFILEVLIILRYDGYHYSTNFILQIGTIPQNVPLVIAFSWGMIIMASMNISDRFGIKSSLRPFLDTLQAMTIDLTMDVTAIRIEGGFWIWGTPMTDYISPNGYYGVIWGNFIAWYLVVLVFSYFIRFSKKLWEYNINIKMLIYHLLTPIVAFIPFYLLLEGTRWLNYLLWLTTGWVIHFFYAWFIIIIITIPLILIIYEIINKRYSISNKGDFLPILLFLSFHIFYFSMFLYLGLFKTMLFAGIVSIIAIILDMGLHYLIKHGKTNKNEN